MKITRLLESGFWLTAAKQQGINQHLVFRCCLYPVCERQEPSHDVPVHPLHEDPFIGAHKTQRTVFRLQIKCSAFQR